MVPEFIFKTLFQNNHARFQALCKANALSLDYGSNKSTLYLLKAIFEEREYADYFPFYEDAVIVDVGAHYGYFSMFAHLNLGKASTIIAIEPDPNNFNLLKKNLFDQKIENVKTMNVAVSDNVGDASLYLGNSVNSTLVSDYALNESGGGNIKVKTTTLAQIFFDNGLSKVDFLKLDCEGAEYAIMLNSDPEWFRNVNTISMEFHDIRDARYTGNVLAARCIQLGYDIVKFQYERTTRGLNFGKMIATP